MQNDLKSKGCYAPRSVVGVLISFSLQLSLQVSRVAMGGRGKSPWAALRRGWQKWRWEGASVISLLLGIDL